MKHHIFDVLIVDKRKSLVKTSYSQDIFNPTLSPDIMSVISSLWSLFDTCWVVAPEPLEVKSWFICFFQVDED